VQTISLSTLHSKLQTLCKREKLYKTKPYDNITIQTQVITSYKVHAQTDCYRNCLCAEEQQHIRIT